MKRLCAGLLILALLSLISLLPPALAQTAERAAGPFSYDASEEVTLSATVLSVLTKPFPGMIMGSHLLLTTPSGTMDASLGTFGLRGNAVLSAATGQQVEITGVMKTVKNKQIFLARAVKIGGHVYTIRNEHGFPVSPRARERANGETIQKGESL